MTPITRRSTLKGLAVGTLSWNVLGFASASPDGDYIVTAGNSGVRHRIKRHGFSIARELADGTVLQVTGPESDRETLEEIRGVQEVVRNIYFGLEEPELKEEHDDDESDSATFWDRQWDKHVTDVAAAHDTATGDGAIVAILDTGIDPDHRDLAANVNGTNSELFSSGNPINDDPWDYYSHGTHVAGIAAAVGNGVIGTAPDAELVSLKVFWFEDPEGHEDEDEPFLTTTTADILAAIDAAATIGADAANLSLGTPPLPPEYNRVGIRVAYERVIQQATRKGTVVVASAGNSEANLQQGGYFTVPNSTAGAMSVSATAPNDKLAFYSNYGTNEIDIGAPGGGYETLEKTYIEDPDEVEWPFPLNLVVSTIPGQGYAWFAGTSMAAPQVSGTVALVRDKNPGTNANQVENVIKQGADLVEGKGDSELGAGRLNVNAALEEM